MAPVLYLVRHGETDWNGEGRLQGWRDIPLNATGRAQAREAGMRLSRLVPRPETLGFVASPLLRARQTADLIRQTLDLMPASYETDERLRELSFGSWEGLTWDEVRARDPEAHEARRQERWTFAPPSGESYVMLADRLAPLLQGLTRDTVLVTHAGVCRAVLALRGQIPADRAPALAIRQGRILVIEASWH